MFLHLPSYVSILGLLAGAGVIFLVSLFTPVKAKSGMESLTVAIKSNLFLFGILIYGFLEAIGFSWPVAIAVGICFTWYLARYRDGNK